MKMLKNGEKINKCVNYKRKDNENETIKRG
jgi:hypothetical protein